MEPSFSNGQARPQQTFVETEIDRLSSSFDQELQKGEQADFNKLEKQIFKIVVLMMRRDSRFDHKFAFDSDMEIEIQSNKIKGTYNTWYSLTVTVISAGLQIAAGGAGFSQFAGVAQKTAETTMTSLDGIGRGTGLFSQLLGNRDVSVRSLYEAQQQHMKNLQQDRQQAYSSKQSQQNQMSQTCREADQKAHSTAKNMLGVNG